MLLLLFSYIIVRIIPTVLITGTRYFVTGIDYNNNSTSIYMPSSTKHFTCCISGATTAVTNICCCCCCCCGCYCCCSHINSSLQCSPWPHRTCSDNLYSSSSVQYARNNVRLFLDRTHARGAQIRYVTRTNVRLAFGEESACTTGRWAFGCSDAVMVNI